MYIISSGFEISNIDFIIIVAQKLAKFLSLRVERLNYSPYALKIMFILFVYLEKRT